MHKTLRQSAFIYETTCCRHIITCAPTMIIRISSLIDYPPSRTRQRRVHQHRRRLGRHHFCINIVRTPKHILCTPVKSSAAPSAKKSPLSVAHTHSKHAGISSNSRRRLFSPTRMDNQPPNLHPPQETSSHHTVPETTAELQKNPFAMRPDPNSQPMLTKYRYSIHTAPVQVHPAQTEVISKSIYFITKFTTPPREANPHSETKCGTRSA